MAERRAGVRPCWSKGRRQCTGSKHRALGDSTDPRKACTGGWAGSVNLRDYCGRPAILMSGSVGFHLWKRPGAHRAGRVPLGRVPLGPRPVLTVVRILASAASQTRDLTWRADPLCTPFPGQITHTGALRSSLSHT